MNWYTVQRRFVQPDGTLGKYVDFQYALGIKAVRELCGNVHYSRNASYDCFRCELGPATYIGTNTKCSYIVRSLGKYKGQTSYVYKCRAV